MICNQENIDRLRALAQRALADVPGERVVAPFGDSVWSQTEALYGTIPHAQFIPHEMRFAAEAQNALLPLLEDLEFLRSWMEDHVRERELTDERQKVRAQLRKEEALRSEGGDTNGSAPSVEPPRKRPVKKKKL